MELESMIHERDHHACTIFKSALHDERPIIIVAGSWSGSGSTNTAEVLDFSQEGTSWQESNLIIATVIYFFHFSKKWY